MCRFIKSKVDDFMRLHGRSPSAILVRSSDWHWFEREFRNSSLMTEMPVTILGGLYYGCRILKVDGISEPFEVI